MKIGSRLAHVAMMAHFSCWVWYWTPERAPFNHPNTAKSWRERSGELGGHLSCLGSQELLSSFGCVAVSSILYPPPQVSLCHPGIGETCSFRYLMYGGDFFCLQNDYFRLKKPSKENGRAISKEVLATIWWQFFCLQVNYLCPKKS